jgi:molybdopterin-guanine dinucleotide biosynthesis protein A
MAESSASAAIILAGGKSTRLGRDKASEPLLGVPLLQRVIDRLEGLVDEYVIVKARGQELPAVIAQAALTYVEDLFPETGPLGGIYTGLLAAKAPAALAVACDMPLLQRPLVAELLRLAPAHDLVVPVSEEFPQPLCAVYAKVCLGPMRRQLDTGKYKITGFFGFVSPLYLQPDEWRRFDPEGLSFQNLNREEDLERAVALLVAEETARAGHRADAV